MNKEVAWIQPSIHTDCLYLVVTWPSLDACVGAVIHLFLQSACLVFIGKRPYTLPFCPHWYYDIIDGWHKTSLLMDLGTGFSSVSASNMISIQDRKLFLINRASHLSCYQQRNDDNICFKNLLYHFMWGFLKQYRISGTDYKRSYQELLPELFNHIISITKSAFYV